VDFGVLSRPKRRPSSNAGDVKAGVFSSPRGSSNILLESSAWVRSLSSFTADLIWIFRGNASRWLAIFLPSQPTIAFCPTDRVPTRPTCATRPIRWRLIDP
jgi:hypothetical protein